MAESNQAVKTTQRRDIVPAAVAHELRSIMYSLETLLPPDITLSQFRAGLFTQFVTIRNLTECTPHSIVSACIKAATDGMLPGRDCSLVPFYDRKSKNHVATYIPEYRGMIRALDRTGKVAKAIAHPVFEGDTFICDYLQDEFSHVPAKIQGKKQGALRLFYAYILMKDGTKHIDVMDLEEIAKHKERSPAHEQGPWVTDYLEMGRKTPLRRLCKYVKLTDAIESIVAHEEERSDNDFDLSRGIAASMDLFGAEPVVVDHRSEGAHGDQDKETKDGTTTIAPEYLSMREELDAYATRIENGGIAFESQTEEEMVYAEVRMWRNALQNPDCPDDTIRNMLGTARALVAGG